MSGLSQAYLSALRGGLACPERVAHQTLEAAAFVDLTQTGALVFVPGYDMGPAGNSGFRIACRDSSGRAAHGFAGPAGNGASPELEAADNVTGITKANPGVVSFAAGHGLAAGNLVYFSGLSEMTELNGKYVALGTQAGDTFEILNTSGYGAAETTGGLVAQRVTNPGSKGLTIYQDKELSARGWAWIDPSFDPNAIELVIMDRTPDLRLFQVGLDLGGPTPDVGAGSVTYSRSGPVYAKDESGLLVEFPTNVIPKERIKPIGLPPGDYFRHEGAGTNLLTYSEQFDTSWSTQRISISANVLTAPNGEMTADKLVEDATAGATHRINKAIGGLADDTVHTETIYAYAGERSQISIAIVTKDGTTKIAIFDLSSGSVFSNTADSARITPTANGWYRCEINQNIGSGGATPAVYIGMAVDGLLDYNGDGSSGLYIWGAQLEATSYATSYIKSEATQAVRSSAAGFPAFQLAGNFNQPSGQAMMLVVHGYDQDVETGGGDRGYIHLETPILAYQHDAHRYTAYDASTVAALSVSAGALVPQFMVTQWWDLANKPSGVTNDQGYRIGRVSISGDSWSVFWGPDYVYDGDFSAGSLIKLFYGNGYPIWWDHLLIDAQPQTDADLLTRINKLAPPA